MISIERVVSAVSGRDTFSSSLAFVVLMRPRKLAGEFVADREGGNDSINKEGDAVVDRGRGIDFMLCGVELVGDEGDEPVERVNDGVRRPASGRCRLIVMLR